MRWNIPEQGLLKYFIAIGTKNRLNLNIWINQYLECGSSRKTFEQSNIYLNKYPKKDFNEKQ